LIKNKKFSCEKQTVKKADTFQNAENIHFLFYLSENAIKQLSHPGLKAGDSSIRSKGAYGSVKHLSH